MTAFNTSSLTGTKCKDVARRFAFTDVFGKLGVLRLQRVQIGPSP